MCLFVLKISLLCKQGSSFQNQYANNGDINGGVCDGYSNVVDVYDNQIDNANSNIGINIDINIDSNDYGDGNSSGDGDSSGDDCKIKEVDIDHLIFEIRKNYGMC